MHTYDPPLLYNLHNDPSEIYALDVKEYSDVMQKIDAVSPKDSRDNYTHTHMRVRARKHTCLQTHTHTQLKMSFDKAMVWGESQMNRGISNADEPCAKPGCSPFPTCCTTNSFIDSDISIANV